MKNSLGLGVNITGLLLGGLFFGVYCGSGYLARKVIMEQTDEELSKPQFFRDVRVVTSDDSK